MSMGFEECAVVREGFPRPFPDTPSNVLEQFRMTGKVVIVTGAADGIGYAVSEAMAEANAHVALWYNSLVNSNLGNAKTLPLTNLQRNDAAIEKAASLAKIHGIRTATYKVDSK